MYKYIIFDLDGTLLKSGKGVVNSAKYALEKFDIFNQDEKKLLKFVGPPLQNSFKEFYNFDDEKTKEAVKHFRKYYNEIGLFESELYDGIINLLETLKKRGKKLIIATSKSEKYTKIVLDYYKIYDYFDFVASANDTDRKEKEDILRYALNSSNIKNLDEAIMIGDTKFDIKGANINKLKSVGVLYGYGSKEELEKENATYILETVTDVLNFLS